MGSPGWKRKCVSGPWGRKVRGVGPPPVSVWSDPISWSLRAPHRPNVSMAWKVRVATTPHVVAAQRSRELCFGRGSCLLGRFETAGDGRRFCLLWWWGVGASYVLFAFKCVPQDACGTYHSLSCSQACCAVSMETLGLLFLEMACALVQVEFNRETLAVGAFSRAARQCWLLLDFRDGFSLLAVLQTFAGRRKFCQVMLLS